MKTSWLFVGDGLSASQTGLAIEIRLPWYRSLPLSTIDIGEVRIDGEAIDPKEVTFTVNGKPRPAQDLQQFYEENWYVLDSAYLHIPRADAQPDKEYEVQVNLVLHPPYIPGVPFHTGYNRTMRAH